MALIKWAGRESESLGEHLRLVGRFSDLYIGEPVKSKCEINTLRLGFFNASSPSVAEIKLLIICCSCWDRYHKTGLLCHRVVTLAT